MMQSHSYIMLGKEQLVCKLKKSQLETPNSPNAMTRKLRRSFGIILLTVYGDSLSRQ